MDEDTIGPSERPFLASRLKIQRAEDHAVELRERVDEYKAKNPVLVTIKQHPTEAQYWKWEMECVESVPAYFSAVIGDAVHNLRTSLDLLAVELVRINDGDETDVYFPFARNAQELENMIKRRNIDRAAPEVVDMIRSMKPHIGGNMVLRYVHDLDVADKHKMILPTFSHVMYNGNGFGILSKHLTARKLGSGMSMRNEHTDKLFIPGVYPVDFQLNFDLTGPLGEQEVTEGLHRLVKEFSGFVDSFELLCFGTLSK